MTECNFKIKNLSCNFGCMLLEHCLTSLLFSWHIFYIAWRNTRAEYVHILEFRWNVFFNLHLFLQRLSVVLVHLYVQTRSHKILVNLSTNVDSKLTERGLQVFFRLPPTHTCIYEDIYRAFAFIVKISALRVASTMTPAVTPAARLHRFAEKQHSPAHSEVHNVPVTKISYIYVCSNPNTFLVRRISLA